MIEKWIRLFIGIYLFFKFCLKLLGKLDGIIHFDFEIFLLLGFLTISMFQRFTLCALNEEVSVSIPDRTNSEQVLLWIGSGLGFLGCSPEWVTLLWCL